MKYSEIARRDFEDTGYGFRGFVSLARREDGKRYRMTYHGFAWSGNSGGIHDDTGFGDESDARKFWCSHFESTSEKTEDEFFATI